MIDTVERFDTIEAAAEAMSEAFEVRARDNGGSFVILREGSPGWMRDVVFAAHGSMLPDDTRYQMIYEVVTALSEGMDPDGDIWEWVDGYVPHSTFDLLSWARSHLDRVAYADEAIAEGGVDGIAAALSLGYAREWAEVAMQVSDALANVID